MNNPIIPDPAQPVIKVEQPAFATVERIQIKLPPGRALASRGADLIYGNIQSCFETLLASLWSAGHSIDDIKELASVALNHTLQSLPHLDRDQTKKATPLFLGDPLKRAPCPLCGYINPDSGGQQGAGKSLSDAIAAARGSSEPSVPRTGFA